MITVGTNSFGYNHTRNFARLPFLKVRFKKVYDLYKIPAHFYFKLAGRVIPKYINRFNDFGLNKVDLYHFFNTITPVRKPWIVTFETTLPREDPGFERGYEWLAGKYCKKIIAYTQRAYDAQLARLDAYPGFRDAIKSKMLVIYPSQKVITDSIDHKNFEGEIVFTITGSTFFLKGGWELVQAFEKLKESGAPVRLNIISRLEVHGYKDLHATPALVQKTREMINNNPLINHFNGLPNADVLEILKKSHVGILPSYGETFGYSLLEAMACGCAVVSTRVAPFTEFVQEPWGWLIPVPVKYRDGLEYTDTDDPVLHAEFSEILVTGLVNTITEIIKDRALLKLKCSNAVERIRIFHDPSERVNQLQEIYHQALNE